MLFIKETILLTIISWLIENVFSLGYLHEYYMILPPYMVYMTPRVRPLIYAIQHILLILPSCAELTYLVVPPLSPLIIDTKYGI